MSDEVNSILPQSDWREESLAAPASPSDGRAYAPKRKSLLAMLFQTARRARVVLWRVGQRAYCNAHPGTHIRRDTRIATTAKFELETGGAIVVGRGCQVTHYAVIAPYGGTVRLGDRVYVGHYSVIYGHGGVTIGDETMIAAHVIIIAMSHEFADNGTPIARQPTTAKGITIGRDCWIGGGVKILDGVTIGDGCVIGAGALVNRSLPAKSIAVGSPARVIGTREGKA